MEMIDGRPMVLSLMAAAMLASLISRLISRPLYGTLSNLMMRPTRERLHREADLESTPQASEPDERNSTGSNDPQPEEPPAGGPVQRSLLDDADKDDLPPEPGSPPRKD
jgi:hypothetical protein